MAPFPKVTGVEGAAVAPAREGVIDPIVPRPAGSGCQLVDRAGSRVATAVGRAEEVVLGVGSETTSRDRAITRLLTEGVQRRFRPRRGGGGCQFEDRAELNVLDSAHGRAVKITFRVHPHRRVQQPLILTASKAVQHALGPTGPRTGR